MAVKCQGEVTSGGRIKQKSVKGTKGSGPPPKKVTVQDMIAQIRAIFDITEEALYIREVTEEKSKDPAIGIVVQGNRENTLFLEGPFKTQVNGQIQTAYANRGRYDELAGAKYTDPGAIFDIMAVTVIQQNLHAPMAV
jgi:type I restriction enzyme, R subunit